MKELRIKTFMADSRRPAWLIELLMEVYLWFPFKDITDMSIYESLSWIERAIDRTTYVKRSKRYKLTECVRVETKGNKLTIFTLYQDTPMVEFEIAETREE